MKTKMTFDILPYKNNNTRTHENFSFSENCYPIFGDFFHTAIMDYALNYCLDSFFKHAVHIYQYGVLKIKSATPYFNLYCFSRGSLVIVMSVKLA